VTQTATAAPVRLTGRQNEILALLATGLGNADIGKRLFVSEDTVKTHVQRMYKVLGVASRPGAVGAAYRQGLLAVGAPLPPVSLSDRQRELIVMIAAGMSNAEIGKRLFVSEDTVKTHARHLFKVLGVTSRAEATSVAYRQGLLVADAPLPPADRPMPDPAPAVTRTRVVKDGPLMPVVAIHDRMLSAVRLAVGSRNTMVIVRTVLEAAGLAVTRHRSDEQLVTVAVTSRRPVVVITDRLLTCVQGAVLGGDPLVITMCVLRQAGLKAIRAGAA
jgi:DNA-binding CsgD family transcriptional regulator